MVWLRRFTGYFFISAAYWRKRDEFCLAQACWRPGSARGRQSSGWYGGEKTCFLGHLLVLACRSPKSSKPEPNQRGIGSPSQTGLVCLINAGGPWINQCIARENKVLCCCSVSDQTWRRSPCGHPEYGPVANQRPHHPLPSHKVHG